jgi:hypothetical protein
MTWILLIYMSGAGTYMTAIDVNSKKECNYIAGIILKKHMRAEYQCIERLKK